METDEPNCASNWYHIPQKSEIVPSDFEYKTPAGISHREKEM